ncbi:kinase-like protein [Neofusicoccum parvum]|nr:kinase-like protein [Neofusicoccum parvum]
MDRPAVGVAGTNKRVFQKRSLKTHSFPPVSPQPDWLEPHPSSEISPFGPLIVNDGKLLATPVFSDADSPNHHHNSRPSSAFQSAATSFFSTASSSIASFFTAKAGSAKSPQSAGSSFSAGLARVSPWRRFLKDQNLLPTDLEEQNWSDRGQHAEYRRHEHSLIPLQPQNRILGHSANAIVDVVRCKRILLARKTIRCTQRMKREDAAREVAHLQAVNHAHVVRLVGTYVFEGSRDLHILLYPVADCDLEAFMDVEDVDKASIKTFFACLAGTLAFLHAKAIKHMDIKPRNLLVKDMRGSTVKHDAPHKIYLADFGISRSYDSALDAETCSPTSFTRIYSAPEVVKQETRGLKADIFSLGCVYAEMLAAVEQSRDELIAVREASPVDRSYQANLEVVRKCVEALTTGKLLSDRRFPQAQCLEMLEADPEKRPSAEELAREKYRS